MTTYRAFDRTRNWSDFSRFYDDFRVYTPGAADWVVTAVEAGAGVAAAAIQDAAHGILQITNDAADDDAYQAQWAKKIATFAPNKKASFKGRLKLNDVVQSDLFFGLAVLDTTLIASAPTDGVWFGKADGSALLTMNCKSAATGGTSTVTSAKAMVADTYHTLEIYDSGEAAGTGRNTIDFFVDGIRIGSVPTANRPLVTLSPSFAFMNGEAVAKIMSLDYIDWRQER